MNKPDCTSPIYWSAINDFNRALFLILDDMDIPAAIKIIIYEGINEFITEKGMEVDRYEKEALFRDLHLLR